MSFDLEDSFGVFLKKLRGYNLFVTAFDIQEDIIGTYEKKGLSREQVFDLFFFKSRILVIVILN